jgi:hypothetical protein
MTAPSMRAQKLRFYEEKLVVALEISFIIAWVSLSEMPDEAIKAYICSRSSLRALVTDMSCS